MTILREGGEIIIKISESKIGEKNLQRFLDYLRYSELTGKSVATQEDVDALSAEVNKNWWEENKDKFLPS